MSSSSQDNTFGAAFLEDIVVWIAENMEPADVFDDGPLRTWAAENDFIHADDVEPYHCKDRDLESWARDNDYIKED